MFQNKYHSDLILIFLISYWNVCRVETQGEPTHLSREKRTLIWQEGSSRLQIITGFGIPVDLDIETVIIGSVIKGNYVLPSNISDLKPFGNIYYQRKKRSLSRWDIYDFLAQIWQLRGYGGKACILRTICELSHAPLDRSYSLFDELIHTVFNPKTTKETVRHQADNEYYAAYQTGRTSGEDCKTKFSDCIMDLVDMFTT